LRNGRNAVTLSRHEDKKDLLELARRYVSQQMEMGFEHGYGLSPRSLMESASRQMVKLYEQIKDCTKCPLHRTRTRFVFGEGHPQADLVFIGEAPGRQEDLQGRPFVGPAGQLLTKMLAAIDLKREEVFIGNILKCRPPQNRDPLPEEVRCCEPHLLAQLAILRPVMIVALGRIAAQTLLRTKSPLGRLRGEIHRYGDIPLVATYHPAALLRNQNLKRGAWEDLLLLRREFDRLTAA
jgi:uracil-DNA glycosylase family 4